jgi:hypothetical protein
MSCEELQQDYASFALGVADDPEREEILEHLGRNCPVCTAGMASAMATVTAMSGAVKVTDPPKSLRRRVVAAVEKEPKRSWMAVYAPWLVTAALSAALLAIGITGRHENGRDAGMMRAAMPILNDPAAKAMKFGDGAQSAIGRVFVSVDRGVVFIGSNLPHLDAEKVFELWVMPASGKPVPAGVFQSQADATAVFVRPGPVVNASAIAVTVEPEGGSEQPTTTPFVITRL